MFIIKIKKEIIMSVIGFLFVFIGITVSNCLNSNKYSADNNENKFIKYVEFNVNFEALEKAMKEDINSQKEEIKINWIELLSYLGAKYGGDFNKYKEQDIADLVNKLKNKEQICDITSKMKLYNYYRESYGAVLCEFLGNYKINNKEEYGLKAFSPIAKTFPYSHYPDFGSSRSFGYSRPHLGHDLMSAVGTPVIAIESGTVEVIGWNKYGGWRVGIRSFDKKRYYYYAHLRKDRPYHSELKENKTVKAGDVIGYVGKTGYSSKENVNNIQESHLHVGLQLIFDESQKECNNEIWIDLYSITKLLEKNKSNVERQSETKEYFRKNEFWEPNLNKYLN